MIFGTGDFARVAAVYLRRGQRARRRRVHRRRERYVERARARRPARSSPFEELESRTRPPTHAMLVAIGFSGVNKARASVYERCKAARLRAHLAT